jgi:hypothetical protein
MLTSNAKLQAAVPPPENKLGLVLLPLLTNANRICSEKNCYGHYGHYLRSALIPRLAALSYMLKDWL